MRYVIIMSGDLGRFQRRVEQALEAGATLVGGVHVQGVFYYQAVLYPKEGV